MRYDSLFIREEIPKRLSKEEMMVLFNRMKQGDMEAREEFINNNIGLVINIVINNFMNVDYDKEELVATGCEALVKAADTYDISKGNEFSTYARSCIYNEIMTFLRKLKNDSSVLSFDDVAYLSNDGNDLKLEDVVPSKVDIERDYVEKEHSKLELNLLRQSMECLSERNREILMLYFGFYNNKRYTCEEIGRMMNMGKAGVSIAIKRSLRKLNDRIKWLGINQVSNNTLKRDRNK
mgnify:FL=1